jgi:hypothetical protein
MIRANSPPEIALVCGGSTATGERVRLTGESTANNINWRKVGRSALSDISESLDSGPVLLEDARRIIVNLNLPFHLEAGAFKPQPEAADASEEFADREVHAASCVCLRRR